MDLLGFLMGVVYGSAGTGGDPLWGRPVGDRYSGFSTRVVSMIFVQYPDVSCSLKEFD
jgi:hypothetical protein